MVNKAKATAVKIAIPYSFLFIFTLFLFFWVAPIQEFNVLRTIPFESIVISIWLAFVGIIFVIQGILSLPDVKKNASKIGAGILIAFGFTSFAFSLTGIIGGVDILFLSPELRTITTILFLGGTLIFLASLIPLILSGKSIIKSLNAL